MRPKAARHEVLIVRFLEVYPQTPGIRPTANRFVQEVYLPEHNARFAKQAQTEGSAFTPLFGFAFHEVLCIQEERIVANDNTVQYRGIRLQIREDASRCSFAKCKARENESARFPRRSVSRLWLCVRSVKLFAQAGPQADAGNYGASQSERIPDIHFRASHALKNEPATKQPMPIYIPILLS